MSSQTIFQKVGATSQVTHLTLYQNAGSIAPGDPILGLAYNTASLTAYYVDSPNGAVTSLALATQTVGGAYSSGGFVKFDDTHMPGLYRFDIPNALLTTLGETTITFGGAPAGTAGNMEAHHVKIIVGDMVGIRTTAMTESYPAPGAAPTLEQYAFLTMARLAPQQRYIVGTTETIFKLDGVTIAATWNLNSVGNPTEYVRAT